MERRKREIGERERDRREREGGGERALVCLMYGVAVGLLQYQGNCWKERNRKRDGERSREGEGER